MAAQSLDSCDMSPPLEEWVAPARGPNGAVACSVNSKQRLALPHTFTLCYLKAGIWGSPTLTVSIYPGIVSGIGRALLDPIIPFPYASSSPSQLHIQFPAERASVTSKRSPAPGWPSFQSSLVTDSKLVETRQMDRHTGRKEERGPLAEPQLPESVLVTLLLYGQHKDHFLSETSVLEDSAVVSSDDFSLYTADLRRDG